MSVHTYPQGASPYGIMDMAGNVKEWTRSLWGEYGYRPPTFKYPYRPDDGREDMEAPDDICRVLRGGSFDHFRWDVRCARRHWHDPNLSNWVIGFRVMMRP
jgi:formylglycine-generating enzyme required for sulfatase activity